MLEVHKNYVLDENQQPIAGQIPIAEFEKIEQILEDYGLTKLTVLKRCFALLIIYTPR